MKRVRLHSICAECGGHGRVPDSPGGPRVRPCPECRGKGLRPTEEGRAIAALVKAARLRGLLPEVGM